MAREGEGIEKGRRVGSFEKRGATNTVTYSTQTRGVRCPMSRKLPNEV